MKSVLVTVANSGLLKRKECARQIAEIDGIEKVSLGCRCRNLEKAEASAINKQELEMATGKQDLKSSPRI